MDSAVINSGNPKVSLKDSVYQLFKFIVFWIGLLFFKVRVWGRNRVPETGSVILAANHQSFFDPPLVGLGLRRKACYFARDTLFKNPAFGLLISYVNAIPVKRGAGDVGAFKQILRLLKDGQQIVLFPESTRSEDGRIRQLQPGVIAMAKKTNTPIVPVALEGVFEIWPRSERLPHLGPIWVEYGNPIPPSHFDGLSNVQAAAELTRILRNEHNNLRRRAGRLPFEYPDNTSDCSARGY